MAQRVVSNGSDDDLEGFGIAVVREDGKWRCSALKHVALTELSAAARELRDLRSAGAVFGLLNVDDEFFVIVRPAPSGTRLLLSDATTAVEYDIARDVLDALHVPVPADEEEWLDADPWEEGDLGLLVDMGLPEPVLSVIVSDHSLYPDEQLAMIAARMGFADEWSHTLDTMDH